MTPSVFFSTSICSRFKKIPRRDFFEQKFLSLNASFLPSEHWKHTFFVHILAKLYSRLFKRKIQLQISNSGILFCDKIQKQTDRRRVNLLFLSSNMQANHFTANKQTTPIKMQDDNLFVFCDFIFSLFSPQRSMCCAQCRKRWGSFGPCPKT